MTATEQREQELGTAFCALLRQAIDSGMGGPEFRRWMTWERLNGEVQCTAEEYLFCMKYFDIALTKKEEGTEPTLLPSAGALSM